MKPYLAPNAREKKKCSVTYQPWRNCPFCTINVVKVFFWKKVDNFFFHYGRLLRTKHLFVFIAMLTNAVILD